LSSPARIALTIREKRGNKLDILPSVKLYEEGGGVYSSSPRQMGEEWYFEIRSPGTYTVEVSSPGYKRVQQSASITNQGESYRLDITLEPEGYAGNTAPPAGETVLAPKALEEKKKGAQALKEKNFPEAKIHLEKALRMVPGSSEINYLVGILYVKTGNLPLAIEHLQKAASLDQKNSPALFALGEAFFRQEHYAEAVEALERGLVLKPEAWWEEWLLSSTYYQQEKYEKARQHAQIALTIGKEEANSVEFLLGKCEAELGEKEEAIAAFKLFLAKQPDAPEAAQAQQILKQLQAAP
jgi:tetratricopeptide (TPR) repeat protein